MELFEAFAARSCYRGEFADVPVTREILTQILDAAISAPSACNQQTPSFVAVDDPELLAQIGEILPSHPSCRTAKAIIVCFSDDRPVFNDISFYKEDCAAAVENMLLAITSFGYASVWLDGVLRRDGVAERVEKLLGAPANKRAQILLPIGVPVERGPKAPRLPFEKRASFNGWGEQD